METMHYCCMEKIFVNIFVKILKTEQLIGLEWQKGEEIMTTFSLLGKLSD